MPDMTMSVRPASSASICPVHGTSMNWTVRPSRVPSNAARSASIPANCPSCLKMTGGYVDVTPTRSSGPVVAARFASVR